MSILRPRKTEPELFNVLTTAAANLRDTTLKALPIVYLTKGGLAFNFMLWDFSRMEELGNGKTKIYHPDGKNTTVDEATIAVVAAMTIAAQLL